MRNRRKKGGNVRIAGTVMPATGFTNCKSENESLAACTRTHAHARTCARAVSIARALVRNYVYEMSRWAYYGMMFNFATRCKDLSRASGLIE